jgi:electron transfer flavoprotein-quinone oxidoreductase
MEEMFDAAIVGGGPAGISAACILAQRGAKVIVLERGEYPGAKNMFGGVLYGSSLGRIIPDYAQKNCPIERNIVEARVSYFSEQGALSFAYRDQAFFEKLQNNAFTVARAKFDRWFADQAKAAGALLVCSTVVTDLLKDGAGRVIGVKTDRADGDLRAKVVLLADGVNSPLAAKTGFRPEVRPEKVALAVKELIGLPEEVIDERFGVSGANGVTNEILGSVTKGMNGVAFVYTNKRSVSVGIGANLADLARQRVRPYELIERLKLHPAIAHLIKDGKPLEYLAHWLPEGGFESVPKLFGDGFLIAGDSAMLFNALHREGSNLAMASGRLAAETILEALEKGDFSSRTLGSYKERMEGSFILKDLRTYRGFASLLETHGELFSTLPTGVSEAVREILTVDETPKKTRRKTAWRAIRGRVGLLRLLRLVLDAWRAV